MRTSSRVNISVPDVSPDAGGGNGAERRRVTVDAAIVTIVKTLVVPVACRHCSYRNRKKIGDLEQSSAITCAHCSDEFAIDEAVLQRELDRLTRATDQFVRRLHAGRA